MTCAGTCCLFTTTSTSTTTTTTTTILAHPTGRVLHTVYSSVSYVGELCTNDGKRIIGVLICAEDGPSCQAESFSLHFEVGSSNKALGTGSIGDVLVPIAFVDSRRTLQLRCRRGTSRSVCGGESFVNEIKERLEGRDGEYYMEWLQASFPMPRFPFLRSL